MSDLKVGWQGGALVCHGDTRERQGYSERQGDQSLVIGHIADIKWTSSGKRENINQKYLPRELVVILKSESVLLII